MTCDKFERMWEEKVVAKTKV